MLYKELQAARRKFIPIFAIYLLVGLLVCTLYQTAESIFQRWLVWTTIVTIGAAILGGASNISEENGKNTLSFLLTRPITRTSIYTVKFLVSAGFLTVTYLTTSLVMLLVDQQPQNYIIYNMQMVNGENKMVEAYLPLEKLSFADAISLTAIILSIGLTVLALTTLVSIFSSSAINTIVATILIIIGLIAVYAVSNSIYQIYYRASWFFEVFDSLGIWNLAVYMTLATGLFAVGLRIFKAKEF